MEQKRIYVAIDLKSFYASVECRERNLDPLDTNLVVADESRTEKTICLAVTPSLKSYGIPGRARLFEVVQRVKEVNEERRRKAKIQNFQASSIQKKELDENQNLAIDYLIAPPQMARYIEVSTEIYHIYLKYIAPEDIHVYSIDEVFMDISSYLRIYKMEPKEFARMVIQDVLKQTGITATAGIGPNLYLCKVAMDVVAKHIEADEYGVRIAEVDEQSYRRMLWSHRPITDFWRIGRGYAKKLAEQGMYTMGDVARCSVGKENDYYNEDLLYKLFGVNAELLIDHAWGYEPCTIADIKAYQPTSHSICSGQVLQWPYSFDKTRLVVRELMDLLALDLVSKNLVTDQLVLDIGYDIENLTDSYRKSQYKGPITIDRYGRKIPKQAHGTIHVEPTSSGKVLIQAITDLYERIVDKNLLIRRINISVNHVVKDTVQKKEERYEQLELFCDYQKVEQEQKKEQLELEREKKMQKAMLSIKKRYGKNAVLKGMNLEDGATAIDKNEQIGGHKA